MDIRDNNNKNSTSMSGVRGRPRKMPLLNRKGSLIIADVEKAEAYVLFFLLQF